MENRRRSICEFDSQWIRWLPELRECLLETVLPFLNLVDDLLLLGFALTSRKVLVQALNAR
jgi:hypothetical protein